MVEDVRRTIRKQISEASGGVPELGIPPLSMPDLDMSTEEEPAMDQLARRESREVAPERSQEEMPEAPAPSITGEEPITLLTEDIEQISEAIIAEKWKLLTKDIDSIRRWQEMAERNMQVLQDNFFKLDQRLSSLEQSIFQKVDEYGKGISDVGIELQAMQKMFKTVMPEFTSNIKELSELVGAAREKPKSKAKK